MLKVFNFVQSNSDDRIYEGYTLKDVWHGKPETYSNRDNSGRYWKVSSWRKVFNDCHTCRCICDQFDHQKTVHKVYTGKLDAPRGQYESFSSITGVRFKEHNRVIFLQIQTGALMPLGAIDRSTVSWLDLPNHIGSKYFTYNFDTRNIQMTRF